MKTPTFFRRCGIILAGATHERHKSQQGPILCAASAFALLVLCLGPARAVDFPLPAPAAPAAEEIDWSGFYLGIHGGMGVDHFGFKYGVNAPGTFVSGTSGITSVGPIGGIQGGFNYQLPFKLVAGVEIDTSWSGIAGQVSANGTPPTDQARATFGTRFLNFGTARLRLGYALGRLLPYLTFGFTYGIVDTSGSAATAGGYFASGSSTAARTGLFPRVGVIGIGAEYSIAPNWSIKAEYLYEFINARWVYFGQGSGASIGFGTRTMYHIGRVGLNFRFEGPRPLAALK